MEKENDSIRRELFTNRMKKIIGIEKDRHALGNEDRNSDLLGISDLDSLSMQYVEIFESLQQVLRSIINLPDESFSEEKFSFVFDEISRDCAAITAKIVQVRSSCENKSARHFLDWMRNKVGQITMAQFLGKIKKKHGKNVLRERLASLVEVALN
jgi:hypothetical protein